MEVSKMGLKILKHLKEKSDNDRVEISDNKYGYIAILPYMEIKELFPGCAYSKVTFELLSLIDQKLICTNLEKPFEFPSPQKLDSSITKFGITGRGRACLEQRAFTLLSKYVPFIISILSILLSIVTLFLKLFEK
ncbi:MULTISPECIES: hypothetical protein [unclassified Priestia]|uniref:hypothetical protein n=1 Tax=unclassified Priestia TaxID=2800374 RepID=UPI003670D27E